MKKILFLIMVQAAFASGCSKNNDLLHHGETNPEAGSAILEPEKKWTRQSELGREIYGRYCISCHGQQGAGDGISAYTLKVKPPDFTDPAFQAARKDFDIERFIQLGGRKSGRSALCPEWGKTLSPRQISYLRHHIRALKL